MCIDGALGVVHRVVTGEFSWESIEKVEIFQVPYLDFVDDERYVIPDKTYTDTHIQFDDYGFRAGHNTPSKTQANVVFLGDSVPFGFGSLPQDSIPSRVSELLKKEGKSTPVINAAVPSYSLNQSVYRYIYDIEHVFPVSIIIMQVYDPAENFPRLGHDWDVTQNWYTTSAHGRVGPLKESVHSPVKYSSLFYLYWRYSGVYFQSINKNARYDSKDLKRYKDSIISSLDRLKLHARDTDHIVLMPITRPVGVMQGLSEYEKAPIDVLNDTFAAYASGSKTIHFLDTRELFKNYPDAEIFVDVCCHLTPRGFELEAMYLKDFIMKLRV